MALFELEWMGGTAERLFQKHRGDRLEEIPWSSLSSAHLTDAERDRLRTIWTQSAHQEWSAAGAFTALIESLLRERAPVDLIGMTGRFVADEMVHVELASRMANAYGGGVPLEVDPDAVCPTIDRSRSGLLQLCELAVRVSCVGESFSLPVIASELAGATDVVTRSVLGRIAADEAPHAMVGWLVLDWALPRLDSEGLTFLGEVASDAVLALRPALDQAPDYADFYAMILRTRVASPLAARGIALTA